MQQNYERARTRIDAFMESVGLFEPFVPNVVEQLHIPSICHSTCHMLRRIRVDMFLTSLSLVGVHDLIDGNA
jgi:hypothetical protein